VSYLRYGENILSFTSGEWSAWWKNLRGGAGRGGGAGAGKADNGQRAGRERRGRRRPGVRGLSGRISRHGGALRRRAWRRRAALSARHGSGRRRGKGDHGDYTGSGVALVSSSAVSPAATVAPSPSATEPAAAAVVTAPVVPAVLAAAVAVATEEAVVACAGPRPGPAPPPAAVTAAADKVCYDAKDYACRDHEQDNQKQFHGTTLPVDAPGCKIVSYPYASVRYNPIVPPCARARVVY
jgi:hypothetical protein